MPWSKAKKTAGVYLGVYRLAVERALQEVAHSTIERSQWHLIDRVETRLAADRLCREGRAWAGLVAREQRSSYGRALQPWKVNFRFKEIPSTEPWVVELRLSKRTDVADAQLMAAIERVV